VTATTGGRKSTGGTLDGGSRIDGGSAIDNQSLFGDADLAGASPADDEPIVHELDAESSDAESSDGRAGVGGMFASLHVYNYRLYFFGQSTSVAGNWMQNVAISWVVLQLSHSGVVLGAMTAARFVPLLLLGPWGGLISDRSDKRRLMTITQICSAVLSLVLALLSLTGHVSLGALIAIVVALGIVNVFDGPARQSLISNMVGRDRIANAIALNSIAMNTSRIVGPAVAGLLIATVGVTPCFFFNAISFVAVIASLVAMRASEMTPLQREVRSKGQIRAGLRYIAGTRALVAPLVMVLVTGTFAWEFPVTLPLLTTQTFHGSAAVYGTIMACLGVGSIAGALVAAKRRRLSVRSLSLSAAIWGILIAAAAAAPSLAVLYGVIVLVGSGAITFNSAAKTLLQLESAPQMRGRVMAIWSMSWQGSTVVGAPIVGAIGGSFGARYALLLGGAASVVIGSFYLIARRKSVDHVTVGTDRRSSLVGRPTELAAERN
jgi:MFS family permease